jgi:hypothetical protein
MVMLTRGQVAKRLGKSIATVRRMEGNELHPERDQRGVLQFDVEEVERLVRQRTGAGGGTSGLARRSAWLEGELMARGDLAESESTDEHEPRDDMEPSEFDERVRRAAEELARRDLIRHERDEDDRRRAEQARHEGEQREREAAAFLAAQIEFALLLDTCSERELETLLDDPEFEATMDELLEAEA